MPIDHKRINGPEDSVPYELFTYKSKATPNLNIFKEPRTDSRQFSEHRKIFLKTGIVSQAKGSAYIEVGETKVIVSVFDPREIPNRQDYSLKGEIYCEFKFAPFSCIKRRLHQQDAEEKQYSAIMKQALEATVCLHEFPNFQVDIYALVLHNDGSALSAAITAAGLALSHAGVPMYDVITSATLGVRHDVKLVDPSLLEQNACEIAVSAKDQPCDNHGLVIISVLDTHQQISQFYQTGNISLDDLSDSIRILEKACRDLVPLVQKCLVKHVVKTMKSSDDMNVT